MTAHILVTTSNELGMRNRFKKTWLRLWSFWPNWSISLRTVALLFAISARKQNTYILLFNLLLSQSVLKPQKNFWFQNDRVSMAKIIMPKKGNTYS